MAPFIAIFDMDGLMLDTERMARKAWTHALDDLGYHLDETSYLRLIGRTVQDAQKILVDLFGPELPYQAVFDRRQAYYNQDIEQHGIPLKPGLLELLDFLEEKSIGKCVASSTPCWFATRKLALAGIEHRFTHIVCGDMVRHGKPAPDLFLEAARRMGAAPARCVVFEDSEAGVIAAHAAGMLPLMVPDLQQPAPDVSALAYRVLPSLDAAIPLLESFLAKGLPLMPPPPAR